MQRMNGHLSSTPPRHLARLMAIPRTGRLSASLQQELLQLVESARRKLALPVLVLLQAEKLRPVGADLVELRARRIGAGYKHRDYVWSRGETTG